MNPLIQYWYFHLPNFILAALMYTLIGRLLLSFLAPPNWQNYIWRAFTRFTDPVVSAVRVVTPTVLPEVVVLIFAVFWMMLLRFALLLILGAFGLVPAIPGQTVAQHNIAIVVGLAILNGIFSPFLGIVFAFQGVWYPFFLPPSLPVVFMLSSLIVSTLTLMIGGVPAGLYERTAGGGRSSHISGLIWLAGVLALTLPALPNILRIIGS